MSTCQKHIAIVAYGDGVGKTWVCEGVKKFEMVCIIGLAMI